MLPVDYPPLSRSARATALACTSTCSLTDKVSAREGSRILGKVILTRAEIPLGGAGAAGAFAPPPNLRKMMADRS